MINQELEQLNDALHTINNITKRQHNYDEIRNDYASLIASLKKNTGMGRLNARTRNNGKNLATGIRQGTVSNIKIGVSWMTNFQSWMKENTDLINRFCETALMYERNYDTKASAKYIIEMIRRHECITKTRISHYKIDNSVTSDLARYAMAKHPQLRGYFKTRKRACDK